MNVLKYREYQIAEDLSNFIANPMINESDGKGNQINDILKKMSRDLKFNYGLVFTFGVGVKAMYPIVDGLISNGTLKVDLTMENIVLVCIAALTITYLEESKNKSGDEILKCDCDDNKNCQSCNGTGSIKSIVSKDDARTILEELKLRGIGNGIIKKMVECFKFIGGLIKVLFNNTPYVVSGLIDMLAYTSILLPAMNGISAIVGKYNLTMDTLIGNSEAIILGISTFLSKYGFDWLVKKVKGRFKPKDDTLQIKKDIKLIKEYGK